MNDNLGTWLPGAILIVIGGMYGHLLGSLPRRPAWKKRAYTVHILMLALGGLFVMVGLMLRFAADDPSHSDDWLVPGAIFMVVIACVTPALKRLIR